MTLASECDQALWDAVQRGQLEGKAPDRYPIFRLCYSSWPNVIRQLLDPERKVVGTHGVGKQELLALLTTTPSLDVYFARLGHSYWLAGQFRTAQDHFRLADKLDPRVSDGKWEMYHALCQIHLNERNLDAALVPCRLAAFMGKSPTGYPAYGRLLVERNEPEKAIRYLTGLLETNPGASSALYWRGQAYEAMGDTANATTDYQTAIHYQPDYPWAYLALGQIRMMQGEMCEAYRLYERVLQSPLPIVQQTASQKLNDLPPCTSQD